MKLLLLELPDLANLEVVELSKGMVSDAQKLSYKQNFSKE